MNKFSIIVMAALVAGATSLSALAQPGPHGPGGPGGPDGRDGRGPAPQMQQHQPRPQVQPLRGPGRQTMPQRHRGPQAGHGHRADAGPDHRWTQGTRVPPQFRGKQYVVNDWHRHGLKRPGRGLQWVQYGGDYLLVAAATGVIAQIIFSH